MTSNYAFDFPSVSSRQRENKRIKIAGQWLTTTPVFFAYWKFATERQEIFFRRLRGSAVQEATRDPILSRYKFTNAYRASDRVSQYLIRHVIYRDDLPNSVSEIFFRTLLFKIFNRIETWEHLQHELGEITLERYRFEAFDRVLRRCLEQGQRIYSAAYIMPSAGSAFGHRAKHQNHLRLLEYFIAKEFPAKLQDCSSMAEAFALLRSAPSIGDFLAYQYVTDINYSNITEFTETEFVVPGPGALDGIEKCFVDASAIDPGDIIRHMCENQELYFSELGLKFPTLWGRPLQLIDCQNIFCEISKYARVAFPEYKGVAGRTRIKQKFLLGRSLSLPWYPPKWRLNEKIPSRYPTNPQ